MYFVFLIHCKRNILALINFIVLLEVIINYVTLHFNSILTQQLFEIFPVILF